MAFKSQVLQTLIEKTVGALGYELWGVVYAPRKGSALVRIYIDSPKGITVQDCQQVSEHISALFDVEDPIRGSYSLEVSSPGMDRPLFKREHYQHYLGQSIQIRLRMKDKGRQSYKGMLYQVDENNIVIEIENGERYTFSFDQIEKANVVPIW